MFYVYFLDYMESCVYYEESNLLIFNGFLPQPTYVKDSDMHASSALKVST